MGIQPDLSRFKRNIMKTLAILACLLALSYAAEKTAEQEQSAQLVEPVDQLPEEQRYGGYGGHRYGGHYGGHGGHRYGRSVADETQELEVEEQRYGGYLEDMVVIDTVVLSIVMAVTMVDMVDTVMVALLLMKPRNLKDKNRDTEVTVEDTVVTAMATLLKDTEDTLMVDTVDNIKVTSMALPLLSRLHTMI